MLRLLIAPARHLRALLLLCVSLFVGGCWVLRDVGIDLPGERELKLNGLQELAVSWDVDNYGRPYISIRLPPSKVPCPRVSDSVKVTLDGHPLQLKESGGPFHRTSDFTPSGCRRHAQWWAFDVSPDAELVLSDGERVIKASGPNLFMLRRITAPAQLKVGTVAEAVVGPASDRVIKARLSFASNSSEPPIEVPDTSLKYEGNKIRFTVPALTPGKHEYSVRVFELEGLVTRCEGVPRCSYSDDKLQYFSAELVR